MVSAENYIRHHSYGFRKSIKTSSDGKSTTRDKFFVNQISYTSDRKINELEIVNQDMEVVFKQYAMQKIDDIKYNVLLEKLKEAEVSMESVVELFHVNTLQELDINQWNKLIRKLEVTIAAKAGRKES